MNNLHISLTNVKNESRIFKTAKTLVSNGIVDTIFIVGLWEDGLKVNESLSKNILIERVKLRSRKLSKNIIIQFIKYIEYMFYILKNYRKKEILIITIHSVGLLPIGVMGKFLYGAKLIYDAHEYETQTQGLRGIKKSLVAFVERTLIGTCDRVIVVSDSILKEYRKLYPNLKSIETVLNTPPYKEIEKRDLFREKFDIKEEQTIFLYQGGLSSGRGLEILLDTFKMINDKKSVIVFMGYGSLDDLVKEASKEYENIFYHEAVSPDILLDYTSSANFGISTIEDSCLSYHYCLPNKIFEYLMANIPVIVSNLPEMKNVVEKYRVGIVANENTPNGLKQAIEEALKLDKKELEKNIKKVKEIYNWEEQEKVLLEVYKGFC